MFWATYNQKIDIPLIKQTQVTDCGLASIAMISYHYDIDVSLSQLRANYDISSEYGLTLYDLTRISGDLGLNAVGVKFEPTNSHQLTLPCILHWGKNHYVVLTKISGNELTILDPATGTYQIGKKKAARMMTGYALEFSGIGPKKPGGLQSTKGFSLSTVFTAIPTLGMNFLVLLLSALLVQIITMITPIYVKTAIDSILSSQNTDFVLAISILFACVFIFEFLLELIKGRLQSSLLRSTDLSLREMITNKLLRLPLSYFRNRRVGDIIERLSSAEVIAKYATLDLSTVIAALFACVFSLLAMMILDTVLATISLGFVFLLVLSRIIIAQKIKVYSINQLSKTGQATSVLYETLSNIHTVNGLNLFARQMAQWRKYFSLDVSYRKKQDNVNVFYGATSKAVSGFEQIAVIVIASHMIIDESMTIGTVYAFIQYKRIFLMNASDAIEFKLNKSLVESHCERVEDIAGASNYLENDISLTDVQEINQSDHKLELRNFSWSPPGALHNILKDITCSIPLGKPTIISGGSGSGKSTFLDALAGLHPLPTGSIFLGGQDIVTIRPSAWRTKVASASPRETLFRGTLFENISGMHPTPNYQKVIQAAQIADIHDKIEGLQNGYNSEIQESGGYLSSGEIQRVILARAIYREPILLLLDEFQSNLDNETAERIWENLIAQPNMTVIAVSHRNITCENATRFQMKEGKLQQTVGELI